MTLPSARLTAPYPASKAALMASSSVRYASESPQLMCLGWNFHRMEPRRLPLRPNLVVYIWATQLDCGGSNSLTGRAFTW